MKKIWTKLLIAALCRALKCYMAILKLKNVWFYIFGQKWSKNMRDSTFFGQKWSKNMQFHIFLAGAKWRQAFGSNSQTLKNITFWGVFCVVFSSFSFFFHEKRGKTAISTSERRAKHPFAGRNIQHVTSSHKRRTQHSYEDTCR